MQNILAHFIPLQMCLVIFCHSRLSLSLRTEPLPAYSGQYAMTHPKTDTNYYNTKLKKMIN